MWLKQAFFLCPTGCFIQKAKNRDVAHRLKNVTPFLLSPIFCKFTFYNFTFDYHPRWVKRSSQSRPHFAHVKQKRLRWAFAMGVMLLTLLVAAIAIWSMVSLTWRSFKATSGCMDLMSGLTFVFRSAKIRSYLGPVHLNNFPGCCPCALNIRAVNEIAAFLADFGQKINVYPYWGQITVSEASWYVSSSLQWLKASGTSKQVVQIPEFAKWKSTPFLLIF